MGWRGVWFLLPVVGVACGSFGAEAVDAPAATLDGGEDASHAADAGAGDEDAAGCATASETLGLAKSAVLGASGQDLSNARICNLNAGYCLLAFARHDSLSRRIASVTLHLDRATSADCGTPPCSDATFHGAGKMVVRNMVSDWNATATYDVKSKGGAPWSMPGALGPADATQTLAVAAVAASDPTEVMTLPGSALDSAFAAEMLAFHISSPNALDYVFQRENGSSAARATLDVTYCSE